MERDLIVVGGRRKADPPSLLLFGCNVTDSSIEADAYLVREPLRKGRKLRVEGVHGRVETQTRLEPGYIKWEPISLARIP